MIRLGMWGEPVYDPFPYIAMHVIHTIGIWLFLAHRVGFVVGILSGPDVSVGFRLRVAE